MCLCGRAYGVCESVWTYTLKKSTSVQRNTNCVYSSTGTCGLRAFTMGNRGSKAGMAPSRSTLYIMDEGAKKKFE